MSASKANFEVESSFQIKDLFGTKTPQPAEEPGLDPTVAEVWMASVMT